MIAEISYILRWYFACLLLSVSAMPLVLILFPRFKDKGYIASKTLGLLFAGGIMWALSCFKVLRFTKANCFLCVFFLLIIDLCVFFAYLKKNKTTAFDYFKSFPYKTYLKWALIYELSFFVLFCYFCRLRGCNAGAYGTERFMDYGFIKTMLRSTYMPCDDMWYAGEKINYYYVGQFLSAFLIRLSGNSAAYGYSLMMMFLPAIGFLLSFSLVFNFLYHRTEEKHKHILPLSITGGIIAGVANTMSGNFHYVIYGLFNLIGKPDGSPYYYWDSTRFIGYNPDAEDKCIHEFPAYGFVLGDLHAHVIDYIFVLTLIMILFVWFLQRKALVEAGTKDVLIKKKADIPDDTSIENDNADSAASKTAVAAAEKENTKNTILNALKEAFSIELVLIGIMIGLFSGINYWDFPIYYIVTGAVVLFSNILMYKNFKKVFGITLIQGLYIMLLAKISSYPFTMSFHMIASKIKLSGHHTPLWQLMIIWGLPILLSFLFYFTTIMEDKTQEENGLDLFMIILSICAIGLVLGPEMVYVDDIYSGAYDRTNTMFKLVFQAYILFNLCFGYMLVRLLFMTKKRIMQILAIIPLVGFLLTADYFRAAVTYNFGGVFGGTYKTLNASAFMYDSMIDINANINMKDDKAAIQWLNKNVREYPTVILEANGDSFTFYERISVFTGQPTVLGWRTHEWLWRVEDVSLTQPPQAQLQREEDVKTIYTSGDYEKVKELIKKYNISYIVIGYNEQCDSMASRWGDTCKTDFLTGLGEVVFTSDYNEAWPLYIVDVREINKG